ncbi:MAG: alpha/beta hydrolase, partial [Acidimicrobiia bacterium]|nr:alpha/beta hydrolase [Acidimicrobiia bacterium]
GPIADDRVIGSTEVEPEDEAGADEPIDDEGPPVPVGAVANIAGLISSEPTACSFDEVIPLPVNPVCHEVVVPENWAEPDPSDQVILQIAVFEGDGSHDDPIIYLDGGPGGHSLETLSFSFPVLVEPQLDGRDFIVFDQRGVGESEPSLHCPELTELFYEDLAGALAKDELPQATFDAQADCVDRLQSSGVELSAYNSVASANDVEAIRVALGYEQLNPIGISYSTRLGQTYMRMYPDSIRSIVLDSVLPTGADLWTDFNLGAERAYRQLFAGCAASAGCSDAYPDFEADFFALLEEFDANPVSLDLSNLITGQTIPSVLDGDDVMALVFQALYDRSVFSFVPEMTATASRGDYEGLRLLASLAATNVNYVSSGMQLSVECNEEIVFESPAAREANISDDPRYRRLEAVAGDPNIFQACAQWPSGAAPAVEAETVTSDIPTLLLAGQYDPITPPAGMDIIAAGLTTSYQFVFPHEGHGITPTECGAMIVAAFIDDPMVEPDGSCIAGSPKPLWVPGQGDQAQGPVELVEFESTGVVSIRGLRPDGWTQAGPGVFARGDGLTDPTTVLVQPTQGLPGENLAALLSSQLDVVFDANGTVTVEGEEWLSFLGFGGEGDEIYEMIVREGLDGVVVLLVAARNERDVLREQILLPMAAAAEPT